MNRIGIVLALLMLPLAAATAGGQARQDWENPYWAGYYYGYPNPFFGLYGGPPYASLYGQYGPYGSPYGAMALSGYPPQPSMQPPSPYQISPYPEELTGATGPGGAPGYGAPAHYWADRYGYYLPGYRWQTADRGYSDWYNRPGP